jgi:hypothetical protein
MDNNEILIMPRHTAFVKFIDVPSLDEDEIGKMAEFQALKEIPQSKESLVISYRNLGSYKPGYASLMLAMIDKSAVQEKIEEGNARGAETSCVMLYSELIYLYLLKKNILNQDKVSFVVHIGKDDSEIMIVNKGRPVFSRGFESNERFLEEIVRSLSAYRREKDNPPISNVIAVYPVDASIENAAAYIKSHFTVPVDFYEYSENFKEVWPLAKIDLVPREISDNDRKTKKRQESILTYSLIAASVILFFAFLSFKIYEKKNILGIISVSAGRMQGDMEKLDKLLKKVDIIKKYREEGALISGILQGSYGLAPGEVSISGVKYDGKKILFYKGSSKDMKGVLSFVKSLESSKYFKKAEVDYAAKKKSGGGNFTDFSIKCEIKP